MKLSRESRLTGAWVCIAVLLLTVIQLAIGAFGDLPQFADKGFGYRLVVYPVLMLIVPLVWRLRNRDVATRSVPWVAFALIGAPFLIDVSGNTAGLYDSIDVWDNINHFVNWMLLSAGIGLLLARIDIRPAWMLVLLITGIGCLLALGWEIGEWWTFIRRGTELKGAYEDTLSDELLGTAGAFVAGLLVARWRTGVGSSAVGPLHRSKDSGIYSDDSPL
ncbi:hypothetical protein V3G39_11975 [Dermatophilaceae bacterium Sec6.4]